MSTSASIFRAVSRSGEKHTYSRPTGRLRWVDRSGERVLQQELQVERLRNEHSVVTEDVTMEWVDVPVRQEDVKS